MASPTRAEGVPPSPSSQRRSRINRSSHPPRPSPDEADAAAAAAAAPITAADLGMAAQGERCRVEGVVDEDSFGDSSSSSSMEYRSEARHGEPELGVTGENDPDDPDRKRAAVMRAAREQARRAAALADRKGLPGTSSDARARTARRHPGATPIPRSGLARWGLYCRVCLHWRVLRHVLAILFLLSLFPLGYIYRASLAPYLPFLAPLLSLGSASSSSSPSPTAASFRFGEALLRGDEATVDSILAATPALLHSPLEGDPQGRFPLQLAALGNRTSMFLFVLSLGAPVGAADRGGFTALHYAAHVGNVEMVAALLKQRQAPDRSFIDARDSSGRTALHVAASVGCTPCMAELVFHGEADLRALDSQGLLPTDYSRMRHGEALQRLLDEGHYPHPRTGAQVIVGAEAFGAMRRREARPWVTEPGQGEKYEPQRKVTMRRKKKKKKRKGERKQQERTGSSDRTDAADPPPATPPSAPPMPLYDDDIDDDDDDAALMALFTGDEGDAAAAAGSARRFRSEAAQAEAQRRAAAEEEYYREIGEEGGEVDEEEFDV